MPSVLKEENVMSISHGLDKMHLAVSTLVGPGAMQIRLHNAVNHHLIHISTEDDVPAAVRSEFSKLQRELRQSDLQTQSMSELEAEHYAQKIATLDEQMMRLAH